MTISSRELHQDLRTAIADLCRRFPDTYWRELDAERAYPEAFVQTLTEGGYLGALIPEEYGGSGLGLGEASIILEEINRAGGNAAACHAQMYVMGTLLRHGSAEQKQAYLPQIAAGQLRLQAFAVTEPTTGTDYHTAEDHCRSDGRSLRRQRSEGLDLSGRAFRFDVVGRSHDPARSGVETDRWSLRIPG